MRCEYCLEKHSGSYGSGRFCSKRCASGFSTQSKRQEINEKVSKKLKGIQTNPSAGFRKGFDIRRKIFSNEDREEAVRARLKKLNNNPFEKRGKETRRRIVIKEQNEVCLHCGINEWNGQILTLEIDHIDGDKTNNQRENLRALCPNCHSLTPTFRRYSLVVKREDTTVSNAVA